MAEKISSFALTCSNDERTPTSDEIEAAARLRVARWPVDDAGIISANMVARRAFVLLSVVSNDTFGRLLRHIIPYASVPSASGPGHRANDPIARPQGMGKVVERAVLAGRGQNIDAPVRWELANEGPSDKHAAEDQNTYGVDAYTALLHIRGKCMLPKDVPNPICPELRQW